MKTATADVPKEVEARARVFSKMAKGTDVLWKLFVEIAEREIEREERGEVVHRGRGKR